MNKIYISGAITKNPSWKENFSTVVKMLEKSGYIVLSPLLLSELNLSYEEYLKIEFSMIEVCDCIYMLADYESSIGACRELNYALALNKQVIYEGKN
jgi:nucleoside 2-deoxyribosyltransferase